MSNKKAINKIIKCAINNKEIKLLKHKTVVKWIYGIYKFTSSKEELEFGKKYLKIVRPDINVNKQFTTLFGEIICYEIFTLLNENIYKPKKINNLLPDYETDNKIIEVKTGTYLTSGTAHEKILGTPFKYSDVPILYNKKLLIICIAGAEKICKEKYHNLDYEKCSVNKKKY